MWRPEGWKNPYNDIPGARPMAIPIGSPVNAFEAGAEAMLEVLRKRGVHVDHNSSFSSVQEHWTLRNSDNTGTYIFIPDDETVQ